MEKMISELFMENSKFVLIGLTGRTGSGCTTAAKILESPIPDFPDEGQINDFYQGLDKKRYAIAKKFASEHWSHFYSIKVSDLISAYLLTKSKDKVEQFINLSIKKLNIITNDNEVKKLLSSGIYTATNSMINRKRKAIVNEDTSIDDKTFRDILNSIMDHTKSIRDIDIQKNELIIFMSLIRSFTSKFKLGLNRISQGLYVSVYQDAGNSIRKTGAVNPDYQSESFIPEKVFIYRKP